MGIESDQILSLHLSDDNMIFVLPFVDGMYYINWLAYVESFLHPWNKSHLVMEADSFNVLLNSIATVLLRISASMFIRDIDLSFAFSGMFLSHLGIKFVLTSFQK